METHTAEKTGQNLGASVDRPKPNIEDETASGYDYDTNPFPDSGSASVETARAVTRGDRPRKAQLFKTARAVIGCRAFKAGDIVSVKWFHRGGCDWYLVNGEEIAYPEHHLTDFVL